LLSLARHATPAQIIILSRTESRVKPVISQIQQLNRSVQVLFFLMDLSSTVSVQSAAGQVLSHPDINNIHVLINNAGVLGVPYTPMKGFEDSKGNVLELNFVANHLGHFLLTNLLLPRIRRSGPGARIVTVSAGAYAFSPVRLDDLNFSVSPEYTCQLSAEADSNFHRMDTTTMPGKHTPNQRLPIYS
jgi:NAD(P)-dependent dehydrogenase (short-subunit alcohol dehydrogenase family)